jgi:hypothetical protein
MLGNSYAKSRLLRFLICAPGGIVLGVVAAIL